MSEAGDHRDKASSVPRSGSNTRALFVALVRSLGRDVARIVGRALPGGSRRQSNGARSDLEPAVGARALRLDRRRVALGGLVCILLLIGAAVSWTVSDLPTERVMRRDGQAVLLIEAANGDRITAAGERVGPYTAVGDLPRHLIDAVTSIEDRRFWSHSGFDARGIARAAWRNLMSGSIREGGSTITQQWLKIEILSSERTWTRKLQELALALYAESVLSKDEILSRYMNDVYLGSGARGLPAAADVYFGRDVRQLSVAEGALLAGLIRAPSTTNPFADLGAARRRGKVVLSAMVETGALSLKEASAAAAEVDRLQPVRRATGSWFGDWIAAESARPTAGLGGQVTVRTTLDPSLQALAESTVADSFAARAETAGASQAALVALRPDGAVLAMVGGRDYSGSAFNRAVAAVRQPGSTFKLFVAYAALKAGYSPLDRIQDRPIDVAGWKPENHSGRYFGRVSIAEAFARSLNAAFVGLAMDVGPDKVANAARELGIDAPLVETPSLALGTSEVTLLDLTGAFASVRAGAAPLEPWGIETIKQVDTGRTIAPARREATVELGVLGDELVAMLNLVVERGTGRNARLTRFAAGKTGTSQDYRDAWFIGFDQRMIVGVWVGNDDGAPMNKVTGGALPAEIWRTFMEGAADLEEPVETGSTTRALSRMVTDVAAPAGTCNIDACSRFYRSFRESDCTYQPWRGPRRLCQR